MIVTFNPFYGSVDSTYVNFLRCVTAIATAAAGTTDLVVNPYTNNAGTIDTTNNCIVSIDANTEAGGWTVGASPYHNVPDTATFTAVNSTTPWTTSYQANLYNTNTTKSDTPYLNLCFHAVPHNATGSAYSYGVSQRGLSTFSTYSPYVHMTFGSLDTPYLPQPYTSPSGLNSSNAYKYHTMNGYFSTSTAYNVSSFSMYDYSSYTVVFKMAVTKDYCIIWEEDVDNNYTSGYSNQIRPRSSSYGSNKYTYGRLMYGGLRTTQGWEASRPDNTPWVAFDTNHMVPYRSPAGSSYPNSADSAAAYMATYNYSGTQVAPTKRQVLPYSYSSSPDTYAFSTLFSPGASGQRGEISKSGNEQDLEMPLYHQQLKPTFQTSQNYTTTNPPVFDEQAQALVPGAYPIVFRAVNHDGTNAGGRALGIYKSMSSYNYDHMQTIWLDGQTFMVDGEEYMPIVFHTEMYLIRKA